MASFSSIILYTEKRTYLCLFKNNLREYVKNIHDAKQTKF